MNKIKKIIGFKPQNLFIAEVGIQRANSYYDRNMFEFTRDLSLSVCTKVSMLPEKTVLVEKISKNSRSDKCYKRLLKEEYYGEFGECTDDWCVVAKIMSPALPSNYKGRIKYSDAKKLEEEYDKIKTLKNWK